LRTADALLSIIVPAYCEGAHLAESLRVIADVVTGTGHPFEILVIDDGSSDDTWQKIRRAHEGDSRIRGARFSRNFGKESAMAAGLSYCRGQAVIILDADLQHPPHLIPEMVRLWRDGEADVVEARKSRSKREPRVVRMRRRMFNNLVRKTSGFDLSESSDFKLMDRRVVEAWARMGERSLFFRGMVAWLGFKVVRIPFAVDEGVRAGSNWSLSGLMNLALVGLTAFSSLPLRLAGILGGAFFIFALLASLYTLGIRLLGHSEPGFTTVILLQIFTSSLILICLGVIGEYLARIYDEVKARPRFVIQELAGISEPDKAVPPRH